MRMRLGLLQDPAVIDRQIRREQEEMERKRSPDHERHPTAKTKEEAEAEEKEMKDIRKRLKNTKPRIKPLSESKAIDTGATFLSEAFLFLVAVGLIFGEQWYSRSRTQNRRDKIEDRLGKLEDEVIDLRQENGTLKEEVGSYRRIDGALGAKVGVPPRSKPQGEAKKEDEQKKIEEPKGIVVTKSGD